MQKCPLFSALVPKEQKGASGSRPVELGLGGEQAKARAVEGGTSFSFCTMKSLLSTLPVTHASRVGLLFALQVPGGHSPKTQNGLLSPPQEEKLSNSQTSLCEMLQEKGRWGGVSLDQSALLPLRFKNIREKTDAHFVDVIKEDR